jgi:hypothetical protein
MRLPFKVSFRVILVAIATSIVISPISAYAAPYVAGDFSGQPICDNNSPKDCLYANGTQGDRVYDKGWAGWQGQELTQRGDFGVCGHSNEDVVTATCPFDVGSGLNTKYQGYEVASLGRSDSQYCFYATGDGSDVYQGSCSHSGVLWVVFPVSGGYWQYVNVYSSDNSSNIPARLCATVVNSPVIVSDNQGNDCNGALIQWSNSPV